MKESAKTFIYSRLEEIITAIPAVKIFYEYDSISKDHLVKIVPADIVEHSEIYDEIEADLTFDFMSKYPSDCLVLMTEGDWIDVKNPECEFTGYKYVDPNFESIEPTFAENELFSIQKLEDDEFDIDVFFEDLNNTLKARHNRIISQSSIFQNNEAWPIEIPTCPCAEPDVVYGVIGGELSTEDENPEDENCGCDNYALAA